MSGLDVKNLAEIGVLVFYAIAILYKLASVESELKQKMSQNASRLDLLLNSESGKRAMLEQDIANLRYECNEKLTAVSQSQRELQGVVYGRDYTQR